MTPMIFSLARGLTDARRELVIGRAVVKGCPDQVATSIVELFQAAFETAAIGDRFRIPLGRRTRVRHVLDGLQRGARHRRPRP